MLARHYREAEQLSIAQIAQRLGRSPATVRAHLYGPSDANKRPRGSPAVLPGSTLRALRTAPARAQGRPWPQQAIARFLGAVWSWMSKRGAHRGRRHDEQHVARRRTEGRDRVSRLGARWWLLGCLSARVVAADGCQLSPVIEK